MNWATHKGKRQIGSDSERWVFLCGSCSPWHFSTVLDGLKIHQACFIFQSKQELTQKYRFFMLLWPTLTTTHCFDTIQRKILFEFWPPSTPSFTLAPSYEKWKYWQMICFVRAQYIFFSGTENTSCLNEATELCIWSKI